MPFNSTSDAKEPMRRTSRSSKGMASPFADEEVIAFVSGLAAMLFLMKGCRRIIALGAAAFVAIVVMLPAGAERAVSAGAVSNDLSIRNRLLVWRGALEMIADYPRGVGVGKFGEVFEKFYQEPWHKGSYSTAVNDYLTFAAEHGLAPVLTAIAGIAFLMALAMQFLRRHRDWGIAPIMAVLAALAAGSLFSSVEFVREVRILAFSSVSVLLVYCTFRAFREWTAPKSLEGGPIWLRSSSVAMGVICLACAAVTWAEMTRTVRHHQLAMASDSGNSLPMIEYLPGNRKSQGTVLFLPQEDDPLEITGRRILRPLANNGWRAVTLDLPVYDQDAMRAVGHFAQNVRGPLIILAEKSKARVALGMIQAASSEDRPRLALIQQLLHSALSECDQSAVVDAQSLHLATIDAASWERFTQNAEVEAEKVSDRLKAIALGGDPAGSADLIVSTTPQTTIDPYPSIP